MKPIGLASLVVLTAMGASQAQTNEAGATKDQGYASGSSNSGKSGMSSSHTAPTAPTSGKLGTTESGTPGHVDGTGSANDRR